MIRREQYDDVAVLVLDDGKVNALSVDLLTAISAALDDLRDADALVVTGAGTTFSAGADLDRIVNEGDDYIAAFLTELDRALRALFSFRRPVVTAVNGHAIAGGCILACCGDRRLMSQGRIGLAEALVGVSFPVSAWEICAWAAPLSVDDLALTGRLLPPEQAREAGLVHVVTDDLLGSSVEEAGRLARHPRRGWEQIKQQTRHGALARMRAAGSWDAEVLATWQAPEVLDGIRDYMDRLGTA